jgi:DNA end-binding protein Ku
LALLIPTAEALMLNTIRWATEVRGAEGLVLPPAGKSGNQLKPGELKMAAQLIEEMTTPWESEAYTDTFAHAIGELVKQKAKAGEAQEVTPLETSDGDSKTSNVVDLTELLAKSLQGKKPAAEKIEEGKTASSKGALVKAPAAKKKRA